MDLLADVLLMIATSGAAVYCIILGKRLKRFRDVQGGMGPAIAALSGQVSDLTQTVDRAQSVARVSEARLLETTERAEAAARKLELLIASLHDLPDNDAGQKKKQAEAAVQFLRSEERRVVGDSR